MSEVDPDVWAAAARRLAPVAPPPPGALTSIPARRGARVVVVAGPGVLAARASHPLRTLAGITGATVVSSVGAKGLFAWDDPLHGGTVGLQAEDPTLAEITTADLVVTTGLDPAESVTLTVALGDRAAAEPTSVVDIHPAHLALAAGGWPPADGPGQRPPIYDRIAAVVGPMYDEGWADAMGEAAVAPPRAARALATALPEGGLVVAPPGPTGFWIGRTFPTSVPGSVIVPTGDPEGAAEAVALEAARPGRPTTLVVAAHELPATVADGSLVALAAAEQLPLTVEVWTDGRSDAEHDPARRRVTVDWSALEALVAVAGEPDPATWPGRAS
ncbi:MAG: hypothetical protein ACR2JF_05725 [Iamia sp.]